jgi:hypothetical protein
VTAWPSSSKPIACLIAPHSPPPSPLCPLAPFAPSPPLPPRPLAIFSPVFSPPLFSPPLSRLGESAMRTDRDALVAAEAKVTALEGQLLEATQALNTTAGELEAARCVTSRGNTGVCGGGGAWGWEGGGAEERASLVLEYRAQVFTLFAVTPAVDDWSYYRGTSLSVCLYRLPSPITRTLVSDAAHPYTSLYSPSHCSPTLPVSLFSRPPSRPVTHRPCFICPLLQIAGGSKPESADVH